MGAEGAERGSADALELAGLTRSFEGGAGVHDIDLVVPAGGILALLGPSGSGKTTTLRLLAGFETPDSGRILAGGQDVTRLAPAARRFGMVFQHYALFPHLDVAGNVGFGLEGKTSSSDSRRSRVQQALAAVDLPGFESRAIASLSGGQQQRVALARALAPAPRVLLLDEPLSNLDPSLRERTRRELRELIERIGITTIIVTHEQEEAFDLADRIALLNQGRLEQVGTPQMLYDHPASAFAAGFVGRSSTLQVEVVSNTRPALVRFPGGSEVTLDLSCDRTGPATLCLRPEALSFAEPGPAAMTVTHRRFLGASALYTIAWDGAVVEAVASPDAASVGDDVGLTIGPRGVFLFPRLAE